MAITFVPGQGWVMDGGFNVSAGSQDIAYAQEQRAEQDAVRRGMLGQIEQYAEQDNLDWLKNNIGDSWWWSVGRLPKLAEDTQWFWNEFGGRSDDEYARNAEIVNRYNALIASGMSQQDIVNSIWGGANLSPSFSGNNNNNTNNTGGNTDSNTGGNNNELGNWQSMLNPNNDLLKNLIYGDLNGMLENK